MTGVWAVVPVKELADAKQRLPQRLIDKNQLSRSRIN